MTLSPAFSRIAADQIQSLLRAAENNIFPRVSRKPGRELCRRSSHEVLPPLRFAILQRCPPRSATRLRGRLHFLDREKLGGRQTARKGNHVGLEGELEQFAD